MLKLYDSIDSQVCTSEKLSQIHRKYGSEFSLAIILEMEEYQDQLKMSFSKKMAQ